MVKSLGLQADEPPLIPPPAPCHSFSGEHGGATVHIVCFGERQWRPLLGELPMQWRNAGAGVCLCWSWAPWCTHEAAAALTVGLLVLHLLNPPQASARRLGWTMWAPSLLHSPPTWLSKPLGQTSSSAQVSRLRGCKAGRLAGPRCSNAAQCKVHHPAACPLLPPAAVVQAPRAASALAALPLPTSL